MRADTYLFEKGYYSSRTKSAEAITRGDVLINGKKVKPSLEITSEVEVSKTDSALDLVSNGGYKLKKAIETFGVELFKNKVVADIGASTGGFTEQLLFFGAKKVYAVDVGENQLNKVIAENDKVVIKDNTNARYLTKNDFLEELDAITVDVSFISLTYILGTLKDLLSKDGFIICLIKPQFECENKNISKNGIVNKSHHVEIVDKIYDYSLSVGLYPKNFTFSPVKAGKNIEYLMLLDKNGNNVFGKEYIHKILREI